MRRLMLLLVFMLGIAMAGAPAASAGGDEGPVTVPVPDFSGTLVGYCAFHVHFRSVTNHQHTTIYPDGRTVTRGKLTVALRNTTTDKHLLIDISGPGYTYPRPHGRTLSVATARSAVFLLAEESRLGHPIFWLVTQGAIRTIIRPDGSQRLKSYPEDHIVNLCHRLS